MNAWLLAAIPHGTHPVVVTVDDDGSVTLLFKDDAAVGDPPAPWRPADRGDLAGGPVGWQASLGDRGPERGIGLPLPVTLGRTGDRTVYANLAAVGHLAVVGPPAAVARRLQAITMEVATSRIAVPVEVAVAGDGLLGTLPAVRHIHDPHLEIDAALAEHDAGVIAEDRTVRLVVCHPDTPAPDVPVELTGFVGVVAANPPQPGSWVLQLDGDGDVGRLELPDGGLVDLALPDLDPQLLDAELVRLDGDATTPHRPPPQPSDAPAAADAHDDDDTAAADPPAGGPAVEPAWCEVQLLGDVRVVRDGQPVDGLTPRPLELLAYLATHRTHASTRDRVDDAIWDGKAAPPGSQRVTALLTRLRGLLGDGPDGHPLVPRRSDGTQPLGLSEHVGCDLDRAFTHLARANERTGDDRVVELTAALALVRGEPFADLPVSWATEITQRAIIELQDAAIELATTQRAAGRLDAAADAIDAGLRLLDPCDVLYLERAELERARGRPDRIPHIWRRLRQRHAADADGTAGTISQPAPEIELAFHHLMGGG